MSDHPPEPGAGSGPVYEIRFRGEVPTEVAAEIGPVRAAQQGAETVIVVSGADDEELHRAIRRVEELGLELRGITRRAEGTPGPQAQVTS